MLVPCGSAPCSMSYLDMSSELLLECPECVLLSSTDQLRVPMCPHDSELFARTNGLTCLHALALAGASPAAVATAAAAVAQQRSAAGGGLEAQLDYESKLPLHQL